MPKVVRMLVLAATCAVSWSARATCTVPPPVQVQLDLAGKDGHGHYNRGFEYYDISCYDDAATELATAVKMLVAAGAADDDQLLALARDALTLAKAQQTLRAGDRATAVAKMMEVAGGAESLVQLRAIIAVMPLLAADSPHWPVLERELEVLAGTGAWQAEKVLAQRLLVTKRGAVAARQLEERLASAQNVHDAYGSAILLADVWRAMGRTLDAWLLIRRIEDGAGTDLLDAELRVEFVGVAFAVAAARASAGDPVAAQAKQVYDSALREAGVP
jgi:hypothetical protein